MRFKTILFDGHESDIAIAFAKNAKEKNIPMILDAGSVHHGTNELIHLVDYIISSAVFAKDFTKENDQEKALFELSCYASKVVITIGEHGCIWYNRPDYGRLPAFSVNVVDTTGCGDAFHGAFAAGVAAGMKWKEILKFSSAAGAFCCTKKGGRLGMPTKEEVINLIQWHNEFFHTARFLVQPSEPLNERWKAGWNELKLILNKLEKFLTQNEPLTDA